MSREIERDTNGKFAPGQSGNPDGARLRKPRELLTVDDLQRIQLEIAAEVVGHRNGKPVTRFENAARNLAKGDGANRLALRDHIELTKGAAYYFNAVARRAANKARRSW